MSAFSEVELAEAANTTRATRQIKADMRWSPRDKRRKILKEEILRRTAAGTKESSRRKLEALIGQLPVGGEVARMFAPAASVVPAAPKTPGELLEDFLRAVKEKSISPAEKSLMGKRLAEAGFLAPAAAAAPAPKPEPVAAVPVAPTPAPVQEILVSFPSVASQPLSLQTAGELLQVALKTLDNINRTAALANTNYQRGRPSYAVFWDARTTLGEVLAQSIKSNRSLASHFENASQNVGSALTMLVGGPNYFGKKFVDRFSPLVIQEVVEAQRGWGGLPGRCWEHYRDMWKEVATAALAEDWVKTCFVDYLRSLPSAVPGGR